MTTRRLLCSAFAALTATRGLGGAGRGADAGEVSVPAELDALRRARAVLRRARQGLLQGGRPRRRNHGGQRLDHRRAACRQRDQSGRLCGCRHDDARGRRRHADQGGRRHAAAEPDVVHLSRGRGAPDQDRGDQGQPHRDDGGRREPRDLHRVHGQARHVGRRREADHRRQSAVEGAGRAQQAGRRAARLLHGPGPAHAAADRREDGLDAPHRPVGHLDLEQRDHREQCLG